VIASERDVSKEPASLTSNAAYKKYLLGVLLVIFAFNQVDRLALGVVLQDIKSDLHLSDTELGLLSGIAFALFYSLMGVPIARWADRGNRIAIISLTATLWSAAVALCGAAGNFLQLLAIRIGVAVGEAGCIPPAHSLIADHFSRSERPRAVAIYMLGSPLSVVIGYFLAGWLNEFYGWRTTFVVLGLPGLILAALAWCTLKESRASTKARIDAKAAARSSVQPSLKVVCAALWTNTTYRNLVFGYSVVGFFTYGIVKWQPSFFIRSHGLETGELGTWFTAIYGVCGFLGTYWGGELASRRAAQNERLQLKGMAVAFCSFGVITALVYLSPNRYLAFALMGVATLGVSMISGPLFATIQSLVPDRMRATSIAFIYLFANLIGMGLGPLAAGALSDFFHSWAGDESLRYALLSLCPGYLWGGWHLWRASRTVKRDLEAVPREPHQASREEGEDEDEPAKTYVT
jgi:MFS transporter, Spinster family, sphingosine-1-phosphate transporter